MSEVLDRLLPVYEFSERHRIVVHAGMDRTFEAVEAMDLTDSSIARTLMTLWRIPARVMVKELPERHMSVADFLPLHVASPTDLVRGLVGGKGAPENRKALDPAQFIALDDPGCIKLVWGFHLSPAGDGRTLVVTETRVHCTDARIRRSFTVYWCIIRPWSGLIRRRLLASIKQKAEGSSGPSTG